MKSVGKIKTRWEMKSVGKIKIRWEMKSVGKIKIRWEMKSVGKKNPLGNEIRWKKNSLSEELTPYLQKSAIFFTFPIIQKIKISPIW